MPPPLHSALPASSSTMSRTHTRPSVEHTSPPCLPTPPSGALHATSVCPTGEDLPPPERDRGHPSAEIKLLQDGAERLLEEAGAARHRHRRLCLGPGDTPPIPTHARAAHALCSSDGPYVACLRIQETSFGVCAELDADLLP